VRGAGVRELKAELRENRGWPLVNKGELHQVFKFKLRNQVRGAFHVNIDCWSGLYEILCHLNMCCDWIIFLLISGNFPETAWRAIHSRQAAHLFVCTSLCYEMQRLAVIPCAARRLIVWAILGVFGMNCLAGLVMIARRRG